MGCPAGTGRGWLPAVHGLFYTDRMILAPLFFPVIRRSQTQQPNVVGLVLGSSMSAVGLENDRLSTLGERASIHAAAKAVVRSAES